MDKLKVNSFWGFDFGSRKVREYFFDYGFNGWKTFDKPEALTVAAIFNAYAASLWDGNSAFCNGMQLSEDSKANTWDDATDYSIIHRKVKVKKILPILLLVVAVGVRAESDEKVLWPSAGAELKAQCDSAITVLADGKRRVVTGTAAKWLGMRLDFTAGEIDLSDCTRIRIAVSNTTAREIKVALNVKAHVQQGGAVR